MLADVVLHVWQGRLQSSEAAQPSALAHALSKTEV